MGYRTPVKYGDSIWLKSWEGFPDQVTVTRSSGNLGEDRAPGAGARVRQELWVGRQERSGWSWSTAREEGSGARLIRGRWTDHRGSRSAKDCKAYPAGSCSGGSAFPPDSPPPSPSCLRAQREGPFSRKSLAAPPSVKGQVSSLWNCGLLTLHPCLLPWALALMRTGGCCGGMAGGKA